MRSFLCFTLSYFSDILLRARAESFSDSGRKLFFSSLYRKQLILNNSARSCSVRTVSVAAHKGDKIFPLFLWVYWVRIYHMLALIPNSKLSASLCCSTAFSVLFLSIFYLIFLLHGHLLSLLTASETFRSFTFCF